MTVFYRFDGKMYINITNGCPCDCVFCIRQNGDGITGSDSLWLEHEPDIDEIKAAFEAFDKTGINEAVFCGYGEPTVRAEMLLQTAEYIKQNSDMKIRLNTNGLVRLIHSGFDISRFKGLIDCVSISLNAPNAKRYNEVTRPSFGERAFDEMLNFAEEMKGLGIETGFTVVDVISEEEISECKKLCEGLGIPLRIRHYVTDNESYT
ncbi:MAG: TIGR04100 family radical SAM protein [Oscillospiraceae bacterium]|nr:TIGR04100 family radical SAM protein [Oscillospiraceae bacterium]